MDVAELVVTSIIAIVGLYLAHGLRRQQNLKIAERRIDAYSGLWELMELARPIRLKPWDGAGRLSPLEAKSLCEQMTAWYYKSGSGMLLTHDTREMYLKAKVRLGTYSLSSEAGHDGEQLIHDLSMLRTQMKRDLNIYGTLYYDPTDADRAFLDEAGFGSPTTWPPIRWYQRLPGFRPKRGAGTTD